MNDTFKTELTSKHYLYKLKHEATLSKISKIINKNNNTDNDNDNNQKVIKTEPKYQTVNQIVSNILEPHRIDPHTRVLMDEVRNLENKKSKILQNIIDEKNTGTDRTINIKSISNPLSFQY